MSEFEDASNKPGLHSTLHSFYNDNLTIFTMSLVELNDSYTVLISHRATPLRPDIEVVFGN